MSNLYDQDEKTIVMDLVDHPVDTDPETPGRTSGKFFAAYWTGVVGEIAYGGDDARLVLPIDLGKRHLG